MLFSLPHPTSHASESPVGRTSHLPESHHHSSPWLLRTSGPATAVPGWSPRSLPAPGSPLTTQQPEQAAHCSKPCRAPLCTEGQSSPRCGLKAPCMWPEGPSPPAHPFRPRWLPRQCSPKTLPAPASEPLHWLFRLPRMLVPQRLLYCLQVCTQTAGSTVQG